MTDTLSLPRRVPNPCPGCHKSIRAFGHRVTTVDDYHIKIWCPHRRVIFTQALLLPVSEALRPHDQQMGMF